MPYRFAVKSAPTEWGVTWLFAMLQCSWGSTPRGANSTQESVFASPWVNSVHLCFQWNAWVQAPGVKKKRNKRKTNTFKTSANWMLRRKKAVWRNFAKYGENKLDASFNTHSAVSSPIWWWSDVTTCRLLEYTLCAETKWVLLGRRTLI